MPTATTPLILPSEALRELRSGGVYTAEIPVEHAKSILVPTLRLGFPAYAFFSAPSVHLPGEPVSMGAPGLWGALRADHGRLALFAATDALPMGGPALEAVVLPRVSGTVDDLIAAQSRLSDLMDAAAAPFFAGGTPPEGLAEAFAAVVPDLLLPAYRALAPDFMAFLERR